VQQCASTQAEHDRRPAHADRQLAGRYSDRASTLLRPVTTYPTDPTGERAARCSRAPRAGDPTPHRCRQSPAAPAPRPGHSVPSFRGVVVITGTRKNSRGGFQDLGLEDLARVVL
jgi:hypothetical protein